MKTRVLSAIVMILIAVPLLIMGGEVFAIFMTVLAMLGLYELIHIRESEKKETEKNTNGENKDKS